MISDLHKIVTKNLVFCVSVLMSESIVAAAASSNANWTNDALNKLKQDTIWVNAPGSSLMKATRCAIEGALEQVEKEYCMTSEYDDFETFLILRVCLQVLDEFFLINQSSYEVARKGFYEGLDGLLSSRPAINFVKDYLLPCSLRKFSDEISNQDEAWYLYFDPIAQQLMTQGHKKVVEIISVSRKWLISNSDETRNKTISTLTSVEVITNIKSLRSFSSIDYYANLVLQLSPTPAGAQVRWITEGIADHTSAFTTPYPGPALPAVLRALEQQQHPVFAMTEGDLAQLAELGLFEPEIGLVPDLHERVGRRLYAALVSGEGIAALALARAQAFATPRPLALRLLLPTNAVELAALPWELLWSDGPAPFLLSTTPSLLLTRHLDLSDPLLPLVKRRGRPLRILALTPQVQRAPDDLAETQDKLGRLWADLRVRNIAEVTEISPVTRDDLARAMRQQPDIVQFTGHGWYAQGRGVLLLDPLTPGASADLVSASQIAVALKAARMVLLTACRGAQSAGIEGGDSSLLTGVAPALSAAGVPLVVGMQLGVRVNDALRAVEAIYSALADGLSAQAAVGRARDELYVAADPQRSAWYLPTLYVRSREPGSVFV